jgi:predicted nuclease of predicted toxin-antitoxin system
MRILLDEYVATDFAVELKRVGFDVAMAREVCPSTPDSQVLSIAVAERRVLVTNDYDFGELVIRLRKPCLGLVIVRDIGLDDPFTFVRLAVRLWQMVDELQGHLTIIESGKTRQRRLVVGDA